MRRLLAGAGALQFATVAAAQDRMGEGAEWWILVFTAVILAALALYIYYRVQEAGFFTFLPQTAAEKLNLEPEEVNGA